MRRVTLTLLNIKYLMAIASLWKDIKSSDILKITNGTFKEILGFFMFVYNFYQACLNFNYNFICVYVCGL